MEKTIKEILKRGLIGIPFGISVTCIVPFIISVCFGDGKFYPVVPEFMQRCSNELKAVGIQLCMASVMGFVFGAAGFILEQKKWSPVLQLFLHFVFLCAGYIPAAWVCWWMQHNIRSVLIYIGIFSGVYVVIWGIFMTVQLQAVKKINEKCKK
jgi:hypothetical protein